MTRDETQLRFAIHWRPIPVRVGEEHIITRLLRDRRYRAIQTQDTSLAFHEFDIVLILENCHWFPTIMDELAARKKNTRRPQLVAWHWEPLPLPKAAGIPSPSLSARELEKSCSVMSGQLMCIRIWPTCGA
jgi:hypothetical protein